MRLDASSSKSGTVLQAVEVDFSRITPELIAKYDKPGPRYTSYPTAPQFTQEFTALHYRKALQRAAQRVNEPLSLYIHVPFCEARCTYCGCNIVISPHRGPEEAYLDAVEQELSMLAEALGARRTLSQMHWGGGTPTYLTPSQCARLFAAVATRFNFTKDAEVAVEVDPCVTTEEHLEVLSSLGFNRISMGLQDLNPQVQEAVHRVQSLDITKALTTKARELGFVSVNLDLMYGLPYQTPDSFAQTAKTVVSELSPDRVAVFSYAHVPWIKPHQRALESMPLPRGFAKFQIFAAAAQVFLEAGYRFIGMDHFAKPEDELSLALERGTLHRNFMGYTVLPATDLVGVGLTAIGDLAGAYVQNEKNLARYQRTVRSGEFPVERGIRRSPEDELRGAVIRKLICSFTLPFSWVREHFQVEPTSYFAQELSELAPFVEDGLLVVNGDGITVLPQGRVFIRNICMPFDTYLRRESGKPIYSRTV